MSASIVNSIIKAIQAVVGHDPVPLHEPRFNGCEWDYLKECLDSTFVSSVGQFVDRFERELAAYTGANHAVAVVNGTAALHVALRLAGVQANDEVLIPALTFIATANAVAYCGAIPHLVDSEAHTLGADPLALRDYLKTIAEISDGHCINRLTNRVIRVLLPMHTFGHPVDLDGLLGVAQDFHLTLIEDAAESLGSWYHGQHTGTFGQMGTLSFNGNKTITTGGGGAILTNDSELARQAKHLTTTAKVPHRWEYVHDQIGYNYRMPNLNAALGCAQLEQLPGFLMAKRCLFEQYQAAFMDVPGVEIITEPEGCRSNYWLQTLMLEQSIASQRDEILTATNEAGLMTRPVWRLMHRLRPYQDCPRMNLPVAEGLERRLINLPSSAGLISGKVTPIDQELS
ncbi:LegC family aminotransferase [Moorena sp. SIO3I6]|uniref:LegC family aminotransferase n=1 Tax=Moorena sp. SIO3I6 TaxID=2607831 RepID=UPI0013F9BD92|nr:LegC family aminotransferase [Moorena sp. SIO3I6]NEP26637.1 LegC family aminotransferase [Moorena sp. SIO3I6]